MENSGWNGANPLGLSLSTQAQLCMENSYRDSTRSSSLLLLPIATRFGGAYLLTRRLRRIERTASSIR